MSIQEQRMFTRHATLAICALLTLVGAFAIPSKGVFAQAPRKSVSKGIVLRNIEKDPVRISNIRVASTPHRFEEEFDANNDWLRSLSFDVENKSDRAIIYLEVALSFPETKSSGNEMAFTIYRGNRPGSSNPQKRETFYLAPGTKETFNVAESYDWLTRFLQTRHSIRDMNRVEMEIGLAVFDNETAWRGGDFFVQDPNKAGRYIPAKKSPTP